MVSRRRDVAFGLLWLLRSPASRKASVETEEAASAPVDAGDGAGDGGEAPKYPSVPLKAVGCHRDAVEDAGMLADQHGATSDRLEPWGPLCDGASLRFSAGLGPFICADGSPRQEWRVSAN